MLMMMMMIMTMITMIMMNKLNVNTQINTYSMRLELGPGWISHCSTALDRNIVEFYCNFQEIDNSQREERRDSHYCLAVKFGKEPNQNEYKGLEANKHD